MSAAEGSVAGGRKEEAMTSAAHLADAMPQPHGSESGRDAPAPEVRRLSSLLEISQALSGTLKLKSAMHGVLEILARHHGVVRGTVTLIQGDGQLSVEACDGLAQPGSPMKYRVGEGISGRVVETGHPIVVPRAGTGPLPVHRASKRPELPGPDLSSICVPIVLNHKAIGA